MDLKIFIIDSNYNKRNTIASLLETNDDNFKVVRHFTNNNEYENRETEDGLYYLDNKVITTSLKNNSVLYIRENEDSIEGVAFDEFYNSNIIHLSIGDFNNISTNFLINNKDKFIFIWLDSKHHSNKDTLKYEIQETNYLVEKLDKLNYLYFLDEENSEIISVILEYFYGDEEKRRHLLKIYN